MTPLKPTVNTEKIEDFTVDESSRLKIPGLNLQAMEKSADDMNLAPLSCTSCKLIQYGGKRFVSINTDHPAWVPGECLNIKYYVGHFRLKISRFTQKVCHSVQLFSISSNIILGFNQNKAENGKKIVGYKEREGPHKKKGKARTEGERKDSSKFKYQNERSRPISGKFKTIR